MCLDLRQLRIFKAATVFYGEIWLLWREKVKQPRRQRQRELLKTIGLMSENNASAHAFYTLVHFFAVPCKTTTLNEQIIGFVENMPNTHVRSIVE